MHQRLLVAVVGLLAAACSSPAAPPAPPTAAILPAGSLTPDLVRNMQVQLVANDRRPTVQLAGGEYRSGGDPASPEYANVRLEAQLIAFGDLNGDNLADAAALLAENYGGSGVFVSVLAAVSKDGRATQAGAVLIDDRPDITSLEIRDGRIELGGRIHGSQDPACCAALPVTESFSLSPAGLVLRRLSSTSGDGTQRTVWLDVPTQDARAPAGPVRIQGRLSAAPSGNALRLRIFDHDSGQERVVASLPATLSASQEPVFEATVDLGSIARGSRLRIEVADVNPADGSVLALDSVIVMIE
jgi:hypothetical protein